MVEFKIFRTARKDQTPSAVKESQKSLGGKGPVTHEDVQQW